MACAGAVRGQAIGSGGHLTAAVAGGVHDGAGEHELEAYARQHSANIRREGLQNVSQGVTTLEEVLRVTRAD